MAEPLLRLQARGGKNLLFSYSTDGKQFRTMLPSAANGSFLPPWDRALRAGLLSKGQTSQQAVFDRFDLNPV